MVLRRPQGIFGTADNRFLLRISLRPRCVFPTPALPGPVIGWMLKHAGVRAGGAATLRKPGVYRPSA
jgi:hypothetical protein